MAEKYEIETRFEGSGSFRQKQGSNWVELVILDKKNKKVLFLMFNAISSNRKTKEVMADQRDQILKPFGIPKFKKSKR